MTTNTAISKAVESAVDFAIPTGFINTFDFQSNEGKMAVVNAINNSVPLKDYMGTELHIVNCITMPGIKKGRNGAPDIECKNVYLVDVDGTSYFSQSDGVARSVQMLAAMWSDFGKTSTAEGYLSVMCTEQTTANGNTLKSLVFC